MAGPKIKRSSDSAFWLPQPAMRFVIPIGLTILAFYVLRDLSQNITLADVRRDAVALGDWKLMLALLATAVSYLALSLYDPLILRSLTVVKMPRSVPMLTGVSSMAVSNLLGFSWLTGGALRYRVYSAFGVDVGIVARLVATSWLALILGLLAAVGLLFLTHPAGISAFIAVPQGTEVVVGLGVLALIALLLYWTKGGGRQIGIGRFNVILPAATIMWRLMAISVIDLVATALTLYVLLPPDLAGNFVYFFIIFVGALGLGYASHTPGGIGVFEAALIAGLGGTGRSDLLAAIVLYRAIYTLLPFTIAVIGLTVAWIIANRRQAGAGAQIFVRAVRPIVPVMSAAVSLLAGTFLLISGSLPMQEGRLDVLRDVLPLPLVETSNLIASVAGVLLLIVARGLYRRMAQAWLVAVILLGTGFATSLLKAIDWETAVGLTVALVVLVAFRSAFYRVGLGSALLLNPRWITSLVLLFGGTLWIGFFAFRHVAYADSLWWQVAWSDDAPRFLRASLAAAVVLLAVSLNSLLSRGTRRLIADPIPDVVRGLVAKANTTDASLALTGDKRFLIAPGNTAFLAYADTGRTLVSQGDPVGDPIAAMDLIWSLRDLSDQMGRKCAFYGVDARYLPTYIDLGLQPLKIGEVAKVQLANFSLDGAARKDWRHAKSRATRDNYLFEIIAASTLRAEVAAGVTPELDRLRAVSDAWLTQKAGAEKSFALGSFSPDYLMNFDHAVLRHAETGRIASFATLLTTADKSVLSLDLMRYDHTTTPAAMDGLFADLLLWARAQGFDWFSLGAAPLAGLDKRRNAPLWDRIGGFIFEHGDRFYHFEGLRAFKQKFGPVWVPHYLISPGRLDAPRVLYEISTLIGGGLSGAVKRKRAK